MSLLGGLGQMLDSANLQFALNAAVARYQSKGYVVQYIAHRRATLFKKGFLWDSTVTLSVDDDGRVHES